MSLRRTDIQLRAAVPADALCLSILAMQVFLDTYAIEGIRPAIAREVRDAYSQAAFEQAISEQSSALTLAELDGNLIGFAQLTLGARHELAPDGEQAELLRLYVQEPFAGTGVGSRLLAHIEHLASDAGATILWLTPWVYNHRAKAFYQRRGYRDHGKTLFSFEGESHENRVYARQLAAKPVAAPTSPPGHGKTASMLIRDFSLADMAAVIALWRACGLTRPRDDPQRDIERKLKQQRQLFLVGELDGLIIASIMGGYDGHRGWLNYLAVDPAQQRRGHAASLVREVEQRLVLLGCPKVNLQLRSGNQTAMTFYKSAGYARDDVVSFGRRLVQD